MHHWRDERVRLAQLPTPIEKMERLSKFLGGPRILVKRDDQTGLAFGGNKTRKLEFLIADALRRGADTVLTAGAAQSNHCRQTAAAAAHVGLRCELILGGEPPEVPNGNLLLDGLLGAAIHWSARDRRGERLDEVAARLREAERRPYVIPYGGSNAIGATGYVVAMEELMDQLRREAISVDHIVFASSSGGTQAGLMVGAALTGYEGSILGISIDKGERSDVPYQVHLSNLSNKTAARLGLAMEFSPEDFVINYDYLGGGYGVLGALEREAITLTARSEGLLLDPVYTGRAMGALIDLIHHKRFSRGETVLFWHTGGPPALFGYAEELGDC